LREFRGFEMFRIWSLAVLAAAIWLLAAYGQSRPVALGPEAPATEFSAARATATLRRVLGPVEQPHPVGSSANAAVRARLLKALEAMGIQARPVTQMSCYTEARWGSVECATVTNVIAGVTPGPENQKDSKVVLLMAHLDSVAAGPGGCDDGCGLATLLETIRALKARGANGEHPIVALFTDGEELGLLGAAAYLRDPAARARTGVVINVEARGNSGPSFLFQTSAGDAALIDLYARNTTHFATSSLYAEIYKYLPNDTDLTPVLEAGIPGYNFALVGREAHYHTSLDSISNIDPQSLQQHGDNALALAQALSHADLNGLKTGNAIYLDVLGRWLPRLPMSWALPLSIFALVLIALAGFFTQRTRRETRRPWLAFVMPPLFLAGSIGIGFALHWIAATISGHDQPAYADARWVRLSLGFGVLAVAILTSRGAGIVAGWLWFSALAIASAIFAPGITPYFLFPALVAAPLLLVTVRGGRDFAGLLAAMAAMLIWLGLCAGTEPLLGIDVHVLFTATAAFGLIALLPLLGKAETGWGLSLAVALVASLALAVVAGLQPAFTPAAPQRLNLRYAEQDGKAWWLATAIPKLPASLRDAANFSVRPQRLIDNAYMAPAGIARSAAPTATVTRHGDDVTLDLHASGEGVMLQIPPEAKVQSLTMGSVTVTVPQRRAVIICGTPDCASARMTLKMTGNADITLVAMQRGLPAGGEKLQKARPATAIASQTGDTTMLSARIAVPAR
jgi:hypothetical protein